MVAPFLSHGSIPTSVKAAVVLLVSLVLAPVVQVLEPSMVFDFSGIAVAARELSIGLMIGASMRLVHSAAELAGGVIGVKSGLAFASVYDHQAGAFGDPLSRFFQYCALMVFIGINGHMLLLSAIANSFSAIPVGLTFDFSGHWLRDILKLSGGIFGYGILLLLPLLATLFVVNLALGVLARSAPQMNIFSVGFQITLLVTFMLIVPSLGGFSRVLEGFYEDSFLMVSQWIEAPAP